MAPGPTRKLGHAELDGTNEKNRLGAASVSRCLGGELRKPKLEIE